MEGIKDYWKDRQDLSYYRVIKRLLETPETGESLLDVGSMETPVPTYGSFSRRVAINLDPIPQDQLHDGVEYVFGDFMEDNSTLGYFDTVSCCQVLEHLEDDVVRDFTQKLFARAIRKVLISVPYRWPKGACKFHKQDPVDRLLLYSWTGRAPVYSKVIEDQNHKRLVNLYHV